MTLGAEYLQRVYGVGLGARALALAEDEERRRLARLSPEERAVIDLAESKMRVCFEVYNVRLEASEAIKLARAELGVTDGNDDQAE